jgi:hypothetical protein
MPAYWTRSAIALATVVACAALPPTATADPRPDDNPYKQIAYASGSETDYFRTRAIRSPQRLVDVYASCKGTRYAKVRLWSDGGTELDRRIRCNGRTRGFRNVTVPKGQFIHAHLLSDGTISSGGLSIWARR